MLGTVSAAGVDCILLKLTITGFAVLLLDSVNRLNQWNSAFMKATDGDPLGADDMEELVEEAKALMLRFEELKRSDAAIISKSKKAAEHIKQ